MGIFRRLFEGKVELEVSTAKTIYLPGETVEARVSMTAHEELDVEEARVELVYENEYEYRHQTSTGRGTTTTQTSTATDRSVEATAMLFGARSFRAGERVDESASLPLPQHAIPSGEGEITKVRWQVALVLDRRRRPDPDADAAITVLSRAEEYAARAEAQPDLDKPDDWQLELRLPRGRTVRSGDRVAGTFVVIPSEELEAQEIRVELVRHEEVPRAQGNEHEEVEQRLVLEEGPSLAARVPREYPFELVVPVGACPTLATDQSTVRWYVRGVISRRLRSDYNLRVELDVYTAPADGAA